MEVFIGGWCTKIVGRTRFPVPFKLQFVKYVPAQVHLLGLVDAKDLHINLTHGLGVRVPCDYKTIDGAALLTMHHSSPHKGRKSSHYPVAIYSNVKYCLSNDAKAVIDVERLTNSFNLELCFMFCHAYCRFLRSVLVAEHVMSRVNLICVRYSWQYVCRGWNTLSRKCWDIAKLTHHISFASVMFIHDLCLGTGGVWEVWVVVNMSRGAVFCREYVSCAKLLTNFWYPFIRFYYLCCSEGIRGQLRSGVFTMLYSIAVSKALWTRRFFMYD